MEGAAATATSQVSPPNGEGGSNGAQAGQVSIFQDYMAGNGAWYIDCLFPFGSLRKCLLGATQDSIQGRNS